MSHCSTPRHTYIKFAKSVPHIDPSAVNPFIIQSADSQLRENSQHKIDMLFGYNYAEILLWMADVMYVPDLLRPFNETFQLDLHWNRPIVYDAESATYGKVLQEIRQFYFPDGVVGQESLQGYAELFSDLSFVLAVDRAAKYEAKRGDSSIYIYR